jgi:hypothetical protein
VEIGSSVSSGGRTHSLLITFKHPKLAEHVSLAGADGEDAKNYEEKNVGRAIESARKTK